ncbi:MAG: C25 family cysteine peptidase, partial [Candidatus Sumerlaeia bacterium]|nr:C25 family cysteine peptidase [Candidatus Sumerlaeia bacterium]
FYVQPLSTISTLPAAMGISPLPELPPNGTPLKGIYVCPAEYKTALQPLVDYRGPGFIVFDPKAAYDHYSYGQESPEAIRDAIHDLIASASDVAELPSIVLVGYATFDARNYLGLIAEPQVPTFMEESLDFGFTLETCLDFPYGLLFGDDDLIDAMVSRLPAKNAAEVTGMVNRILAHAAAESELSALERPGVFVYDKDAEILVDQGYWETLWEPTLRTFDQVTVAETSNGSAEKGILISLLSRGPKAPSFVLYMGHGNNDRWSSQLLRTPDISTFTTHGGYPMVVTFTCLNAYYAFPGATVRTLAESFMIAEENKGAISVYAPCSADVYFFQKEKAEAMMNRMSARRRPLTIGEWTTLARLDFAIEHPELARTNSEYLLFGDNLSPTTIPRTNTQVDWEFIQSRFD